jgi:ssRNA-specific RNase YbeY (16S rRNA maturation enzyme)
MISVHVPAVAKRFRIRRALTRTAFQNHIPPPRIVGNPSASSFRLFGSKVGSGIQGEVMIRNEQLHLREINLKRLRRNIVQIRDYIGYDTYDVALLLIDDKEMKYANEQSRGINKPTDILSFQFNEASKPGVLIPPDFDLPLYYTLGEMLIDVPYVMRGCEMDHDAKNKRSKNDKREPDDDNNDDEEEDDCRGVSGAMSMVFDPEVRINMLLVHGMLHLVGYDHETDDDYELMVQKEEEILKHLNLAPKEFLDKIAAQ